MKTIAAGIELIKRFESCRLEAYQDGIGVWTIGFGHTGDVQPGMRITLHQADTVLTYDIEQAEEIVARLCPNVNANQFAALVSLQFNTGRLAHFPKLLAKLAAGDFAGAANEFSDITHAGGQESAGLVRRRAAERALFLEPV